MKKHERLLNRELVPNIEQMKQTIGKDALLFWSNIWGYIKDVYEINPELVLGIV